MAVDRPDDPTTTTTDLAVTEGGNTPIIIPDAAADDALLREFGMEEHPQGGFHGLLEVIPTKADYVLDLIRANSLWPLLSGLSCCAIEMMSTATSLNDIDRFGMFPFRASPRQADVLIVAGTLTTKMAGPLVRLAGVDASACCARARRTLNSLPVNHFPAARRRQPAGAAHR